MSQQDIPVKKKSSSDPNLRGDYSKAGLDYSVEQDWGAYTPEEHALYRRLFGRQSHLGPPCAPNELIHAIAGLGSARRIPRVGQVSRLLEGKTGPGSFARSGLLPGERLLRLLAER